MAVIAPQGVVGRVVDQPAFEAAKVQLLVDRNAGAGAVIERSGAGGVVVGNDSDPPLQMDFVANLADVKVGDRVVTSGLDGIYPPGFVIGHVEKVQEGQGLYKHIEIRPIVDFRALQTVLVVLDPPEKPKPGEGPGELKPAQIPPSATTQNQPAAAQPPAAQPAPARPAPAPRAADPSGSEHTGRPVPATTPPAATPPPYRRTADGPCDPGYAGSGRRSVKAAAVCLATILALAVQTTMLPFALAGRGHVDLVLVVVIYSALQFGPATGLLTGALAGMAQDALSGGVIGVGGVAKTIVGSWPGRSAPSSSWPTPCRASWCCCSGRPCTRSASWGSTRSSTRRASRRCPGGPPGPRCC